MAPVVQVARELLLTIRMEIPARMAAILPSEVLLSLLAVKAALAAQPRTAPRMPVVTVKPSAATAVDPIWPQPEEIPNKPQPGEVKVPTSTIPTLLSLEAMVVTPVSVLVTVS